MHTAFDLDRLRAKTPGCQHVMHFNQAGAGLPPAEVLSAMHQRMTLEAERGPMETAASSAEIKRRARDLAAGLLGCHQDEIAFVPSGAVAWGLPVSALPAFRPGDRATGYWCRSRNGVAMCRPCT